MLDTDDRVPGIHQDGDVGSVQIPVESKTFLSVTRDWGSRINRNYGRGLTKMAGSQPVPHNPGASRYTYKGFAYRSNRDLQNNPDSDGHRMLERKLLGPLI